MSLVLVTGGSGFIGGHCILQTLAAGHSVRATLRNPARADEVRSQLERAGDDRSRPALLRRRGPRAGRRLARSGRRLRLRPPRRLALPARRAEARGRPDQARPRRRASRAQGSPRGGGQARRADLVVRRHRLWPPEQAAPFDETSWTDLEGEGLTAYVKSKTIAERAAWDFVKEGGPELAVVNPVGVFGPVLGPDTSTSIVIVQRILNGSMPGLPHMTFGVVDVRDVADLHLRAMTTPAPRASASSPSPATSSPCGRSRRS